MTEAKSARARAREGARARERARRDKSIVTISVNGKRVETTMVKQEGNVEQR